jgi:LacI family transcriptional regulator
MTTIKDIAQKLGVSISTVSKGLNGASDISDELRQAVLDTAVEMGYSTKRSRNAEYRKLCLLIENMEYTVPGDFGYDLVLGFRQNAFQHGWDVDVIPVTPEFQHTEKYDTYLLRNGYSGAFLVGFALEDPWMKQLPSTTMPTVLLDNFISRNANVCSVGTDSHEGIALAVSHLYQLGHRKIAFLNGSLGSAVSEQRQTAYEAAMSEFSLPISKDLTAYGYYVPDCARYHVPGFLLAGATAIICGSDRIAAGVIDECHTRGLRVPEDISVIGFDDLPLAETLNPPLSTIRQDRNVLGRSAYVMLSSLIAHIPVSRTMMRPILVERKSTAAAVRNS